MEHFEYDTHLNGRTNVYNSSFIHISLEGQSPINNSGFKSVPNRDYASFVHEYIHYIQHITTPYGLKYNRYFNNNLILFREFINSNETISLPIVINEMEEPLEQLKKELKDKNGSNEFIEGSISDIEISTLDIESAKINDEAVNIGVYDFTNNRALENGFQFGYTCVIESMAHLIQSLINPELHHNVVPYKSAQLICDKLRPELKHDTKLLISICYTSLYFNNPGLAFFEILNSVNQGENGLHLFHRYMTDYSRNFMGQEMPNYKMMHFLMDDMLAQLQVLVGNDLIYIKNIIENCKVETSKGESTLLNILYSGDLGQNDDLLKLLDYYGIPAIDSNRGDVVIPFNPDTNRPYIETAALVSLGLITKRLKNSSTDKCCPRYPICDKVSRDREKDLIDENCGQNQWDKKKPCLFTIGLSYWNMSSKTYKE